EERRLWESRVVSEISKRVWKSFGDSMPASFPQPCAARVRPGEPDVRELDRASGCRSGDRARGGAHYPEPEQKSGEWLQWGRGWSLAEMARARCYRRTVSPLQWGRG